MPLNYDYDSNVTQVISALDQYVSWYSGLLLAVNSVSKDFGAEKFEKPDPLIQDSADGFENEDELKRLNQTLFQKADQLIENAKTVQAYSDSFSESVLDFITAFQSFMECACSYREYVLQTSIGLDKVSGLKNSHIMAKDLDLEMNRLARNGQAFCLAIVRIDNFELMKKHLPQEEIVNAIQVAAGVVIRSMRPFDDAYYAKENEFILCLRQTELAGGVRAFERFEEELEALKSSYVIEGKKHLLTMSSCIAEPVPDDLVDDLLDSLRADIESQEKMHGTALAYHELSPLQRLIREEQK